MLAATGLLFGYVLLSALGEAFCSGNGVQWPRDSVKYLLWTGLPFIYFLVVALA